MTATVLRPPSSGIPDGRRRLAGLDRLRGLALVLMVVDHALLAAGGLVAVRVTVTRASLPLFCLVAGALLTAARPRWARLGKIAAAGLVATAFGAPFGIGQPDVLFVLALALVAAPLLIRIGSPGVLYGALAVAILQPVSWPGWLLVPGWTGYQPGTVLALVIVGHLWGAPQLAHYGDRLPGWLALPGRHPLSLYVWHVFVLGALVAVGAA